MPSKTPEPPITDPVELKKYSGEHLLYELQMFFQAVAFNPTQSVGRQEGKSFMTTAPQIVLSTEKPSWFMRMAAIEAFILHFRNLLAFLFPDESALKGDDVAAHHFMPGPDPLEMWVSARGAMSTELRTAKTRADKELAHLTAKRIDGHPPQKQWHAGAIGQEVAILFRVFVRYADPERLAPVVVKFVSSLGFEEARSEP